jgi:hypothetical protein
MGSQGERKRVWGRPTAERCDDPTSLPHHFSEQQLPVATASHRRTTAEAATGIAKAVPTAIEATAAAAIVTVATHGRSKMSAHAATTLEATEALTASALEAREVRRATLTEATATATSLLEIAEPVALREGLETASALPPETAVSEGLPVSATAAETATTAVTEGHAASTAPAAVSECRTTTTTEPAAPEGQTLAATTTRTTTLRSAETAITRTA